jgi:formylmethanofuran dehydrogenase subunit E
MTDQGTLEQVVAFHGHMCPGLAMGIRAAEVALAEIGPHAGDEEVVAIVETDMCGVDAIQFLTGCTFGKGNLVHRDYGKNAYTFMRRSDGRAIRVAGRPAAWGNADVDWEARIGRILSAPLDELYDVRQVDVDLPPLARVFSSVECASCGEPTMETRVRLLDGRGLCAPCFEQALPGR